MGRFCGTCDQSAFAAKTMRAAPYFLLVAITCFGCGDDDSSTNPSRHYTILANSFTTSVRFPEYSAVIKHGSPFGIISLEMNGQPGNFVHPELPIADWEWFRYDEDGLTNVEKHIKLIQPAWDTPAIAETAEYVEVTFSRPDVLLSGISLRVKYTLAAGGFDVLYEIENGTAEPLPLPYVMIGFPGFANQRWVSAVASSNEMRYVNEPFGNFWEEAQNSPFSEYTLLEEGPLLELARPLKALVAISAFGSTYVLQSSYTQNGSITDVRSAHVNKSAYLTSHLYINLNDIVPGMSASALIRYTLSRS